jgi:hypothetical protein
MTQNKNFVEGRLLGFAYDFANEVAMFLASALTRGIHPPENNQNDRYSGGCMPILRALARKKRVHFGN